MVQNMNNCEKRGFTLVELLVVIALIALLAMLMIPTFLDTREHTRAAVCKNNLNEMAKGIITAPDRRPYPGEWRSFLRKRGVGSVLFCPSDPDKDKIDDTEDTPDLDNLYLVQKQGGDVRFSNVQTIIATGTSYEDGQVKRVDNAHGISTGEGQTLIQIGGECALIRVTYGSRVKFESIIIPTNSTGHNSIHWLCVDNGQVDWEAQVEAGLSGASSSGEATPDPNIFLMRFQGGHKYTKKWPDIEVGARLSSYAMSDAVDNLSPRAGQLMLVEYSKDVAKVIKQGYSTDEFGSSNEDEKGFLRTRHFGLANYATTDGNVQSKTREQLQFEHDQYTADRPRGLWAP